MQHTRAEERRSIITRVELSWEDSSGNTVSQSALLMDRSLGGAGIVVKAPIPSGTHLTIRDRARTLEGTVRYCRLNGREFLVGIQYDEKDPSWARRVLTVSPNLR